MVVLVIGAGNTGTQVIRQLRKNPGITIRTLDPRDNPVAVREGVIPAVDFREVLTPLSLEYVLDQARPDLVLLASTTEDMGLGRAPGTDVLAEALREEMASLSRVPVIEVARSARS